MTSERQTLGFGDTTGRLLWMEGGTKSGQVSKAEKWAGVTSYRISHKHRKTFGLLSVMEKV